MKVEDLVIGKLYVDTGNNNEKLIYRGLVKLPPFKGQHDFDGTGDVFCGGAILTNDEVISDVQPLNTENKE